MVQGLKMTGIPPDQKIYHIVHVDRLPSILSAGCLFCDEEVIARNLSGTNIGISRIKQRRLSLPLQSRPGLTVGQCVPFYYCPRSVMLYIISRRSNEDLDYDGGQEPVVHLEADLRRVGRWFTEQDRRWAFTFSNAGSLYFEDSCDPARIKDLDWAAINARQWSGNGVSRSIKERKQAEFLVERSFPWELVDRVGVISTQIAHRVTTAMAGHAHRPTVQVCRDWYY